MNRAVVMVLAVSTLAVAGCSTTIPESSSVGVASAAPTEGAVHYPINIDNCGRRVTFTEPPRRVVVMNGGSVGEVTSLLALGVGDRIAANAQSYGSSDVPGRAAAIAALPTGGVALNSQQDIPREAMLTLRPDFVISTYADGFSADQGFASRDELAAAGTNTYVSPRSCGAVGTVQGTATVDDSYQLLRDLGKIFDVSGRAERLIGESERNVAGIHARVATQARKNVLIAFTGMDMGGGTDLPSFAAAGIWNDVLDKAGAANPLNRGDGVTLVTVGKDHLAATQVDGLIVVNYHAPDIDAVARRLLAQFPQWTASKDNNYVALSDSIYLGPSNDVAIDKIARLVHPGQFR
ncbi:ABC transporter substrate-binding protein [Nocardia sp. NPDC051321]|uniref:ABC transporter substrate-binding protein n=1 Tax=Nocardia sp. NPDC051321 TaxID=3364323 RepID=UPI00379C55A6